MNHFIRAGLTTLMATASLSAMAENAYYASVDIGRSDWKGSVDETVTEPTIAVGYQFNDNFSVELGFQDFGDVSDSSGASKNHFNADAIQVSVIGSIMASESIGLFAQVGLDMWNITSQDVSQSASDQNDIFIGVGAYYEVAEAIDINFKYQMHDLDRGAGSGRKSQDIDTMSLGVKYTF